MIPARRIALTAMLSSSLSLSLSLSLFLPSLSHIQVTRDDANTIEVARSVPTLSLNGDLGIGEHFLFNAPSRPTH